MSILTITAENAATLGQTFAKGLAISQVKATQDKAMGTRVRAYLAYNGGPLPLLQFDVPLSTFGPSLPMDAEKGDMSIGMYARDKDSPEARAVFGFLQEVEGALHQLVADKPFIKKGATTLAITVVQALFNPVVKPPQDPSRSPTIRVRLRGDYSVYSEGTSGPVLVYPGTDVMEAIKAGDKMKLMIRLGSSLYSINGKCGITMDLAQGLICKRTDRVDMSKCYFAVQKCSDEGLAEAVEQKLKVADSDDEGAVETDPDSEYAAPVEATAAEEPSLEEPTEEPAFEGKPKAKKATKK